MKMKKLALIVMSIMLIVIACAGCSKKGGNAYDGEYKLKSFMGMDLEALQEMFGEEGSAEDMFALKIEGNKAVFMSEGESQEVDLKIEGDHITMTFEDESMEGTIKDGVITFDIEGVEMVLEKK